MLFTYSVALKCKFNLLISQNQNTWPRQFHSRKSVHRPIYNLNYFLPSSHSAHFVFIVQHCICEIALYYDYQSVVNSSKCSALNIRLLFLNNEKRNTWWNCMSVINNSNFIFSKLFRQLKSNNQFLFLFLNVFAIMSVNEKTTAWFYYLTLQFALRRDNDWKYPYDWTWILLVSHKLFSVWSYFKSSNWIIGYW